MSKKEGTADKMKKLNFYDTSFHLLHFLMVDFDNDIKEAKKQKNYDPQKLLKKHKRASLLYEILNILKLSLASKMLNIDADNLINANLYFQEIDEIDMGKDAEIIRFVFDDYVMWRLSECI